MTMEAEKYTVEIDGSFPDGDEQILRTASTLSPLLRKDVRITKIRAGKPKRGLMPEHLNFLEIIKSLCGGELKGAEIGSTEVTLSPKGLRGGEFETDTRTAGSITRFVQTALPCALFADSTTTLKFRGGTNTEIALQADYLTQVYCPLLERFGVTFNHTRLESDCCPREVGDVQFRMSPLKFIQPIILMERGRIENIFARVFVGGALSLEVANSIAETAANFLGKNIEWNEGEDIGIHIETYKEMEESSVGSSYGINIFAKTSTGILLGGSALGRDGMPPEEVGYKAACELTDVVNCGACVDSCSQDQIIIFMALAYGGSEVRVGPITDQTRAAIHVCEKLTASERRPTRFNVINKSSTSNIIQCIGHGLKNVYLPYIRKSAHISKTLSGSE